MATQFNQKTLKTNLFGDKALPLAAGLLMILAVVGVLVWLELGGTRQTADNKLYLLPWVFLTGAVVGAPLAYLIYKKQFSLFHPLVYAAWSYFIPAFVVGGLILVFGLSQTQTVLFIEDPEYNIPLTLIYISLGYAGMTAGFFLPFARKFGINIGAKLPDWDWSASQLMLPGVLLVLLGSLNTGIAFASGVLGYQRVDEYGSYDGILYLMSLFLLEGTFLLWFALFRTQKFDFRHYCIIGLLIFTTVVRAAFAGNRSSMVHALFFLIAAYVLAGRQIKIKHGVAAAFLLVFVLFLGTIYGTTFRNIKQSESRIDFTQYAELVPQTLEAVSRQDLGVVLWQGIESLADRLENVSSVAVVVSSYEKLAPYEESYGLDNNIWKDSVTFFIPRMLWKDKPVASEPRKYGDLYFDYSENSFTITPMGDLLRNFGPVGIPLGMMFLGFILRIIYAALIENQIITAWRAVLFYMMLFIISWESFYGIIFPYMIRVAFISIIGILIIYALIPKSERRDLARN